MTQFFRLMLWFFSNLHKLHMRNSIRIKACMQMNVSQPAKADVCSQSLGAINLEDFSGGFLEAFKNPIYSVNLDFFGVLDRVYLDWRDENEAFI